MARAACFASGLATCARRPVGLALFMCRFGFADYTAALPTLARRMGIHVSGKQFLYSAEPQTCSKKSKFSLVPSDMFKKLH
jgi:hypothetical protein